MRRRKRRPGLLALAIAAAAGLAWGGQAAAAVKMEVLPPTSDFPAALSGIRASSARGGSEIVATGGQHASNNGFAPSSYRFDPRTLTWSPFGSPLQLAYHQQSELSGGSVLVTGGNSFRDRIGYVYTDEARLYNPATGLWTSAAPLPKTMLGNAQSTLRDGRAMIAGGSNEIYSAGRSETYDDVYLYDPARDAWSEGSPLPIPVYGAAQSTLKDGRVLLTGGLSGYAYSFNSYLYDPALDGWSKTASLPYDGWDIYFRHAQLTLDNGLVLVMGNRNFSLYDPSTGKWSLDSPNVGRLSNASLVQAGGKVFVIGGYNEDTYELSRKVYQLTFDFELPTSPVLSGAPGGWTNAGEVTVSVVPGTDGESGVARTEYRLSGATVQDWTEVPAEGTFVITAEGQTTVEARTIDQTGNASPLASSIVRIDRTAPGAPTVTPGAAGWSNAASVSVTVAAGADSGGSGVSRTEYRLTGATTRVWTAYSGGPVAVSAEGETTVEARTVDGAGNVGPSSSAVVRIDRTAPGAPTVTPSAAGWSNAASVSVTVAAGADSGGSGVSRTEYRLTGATTRSWTAYSGGPVAVSAEGETTVEARTVDGAGNVSSAGTGTVRIDRTAPGAPTVTPSAAGWSNAASVSVTVAAGADSGGSGVSRTEYRLTGATTRIWTAYSGGPVAVSAEGETTVEARTVDGAGNAGPSSSAVVRIDRTAPGAPTVTPGAAGWSNAASVSVTVAAGADSGGSGVSRTEYRLTGATTRVWTAYSGGPVAVSAEGETTVEARTVDGAGNAGPSSSAVVRIDRTAPGIATISQSVVGWTREAEVQVSIAPGTDAASGVARVEYRLTAATVQDWTTYTGPFAVTAPGQTTVHARTVDRAGNVGSLVLEPILIDRAAPTAPTVTPSAVGWTNAASVSVTVAAGTDSGGSGVSRTEYRLTGATMLGWTTYSGPLTVSAEGETTIEARTVDRAGNTSPAASAVVKIDRTAPAAPQLQSPADGASLNTGEIVLEGIAEPMAIVQVTVSGELWGEDAADAEGRWSLAAPAALADGSYSVVLHAADALGNRSGPSAARSFSVDMEAPAAPIVLDPDPDAWLPAAPASFSGTAEPGARVTVLLNDTVVGVTYAVYNGIPGAWSLPAPSPLADGTYRLSAVAADAAGNASPESEPSAWTVDTRPPDAPSILLPAADSSSSIARPLLSGVAESFAQVRLYLDGESIGTIKADEAGSWRYVPDRSLELGTYAVQAQAVDRAGHASPLSVPLRFTVVSGNSGLRALAVTGLKLNETVTETTYRYTANAPFEMEEAYIEAEPAHAGASVRLEIGGAPAPNPLLLRVGEQTVSLVVTAEDGTTVQAYELTIYRAEPPPTPEPPATPTPEPPKTPTPEPPATPTPEVPATPTPEPTGTPTPEPPATPSPEQPGTSAPPATATPSPQPVPTEPPDTPAPSTAPAGPAEPTPGGMPAETPAPPRCASGNAAPFTDLKGHWASQAIAEAFGCGIVSGFADGTFRPNNGLTRAQFAVMLLNALEPLPDGAGPRSGADVAASFRDAARIPDWALQAVGEARARGIVRGYEDGTFRPDAVVTRAEMLVMAGNALRLEPLAQEAAASALRNVADRSRIPAWAAGYVSAAIARGLAGGRPDGSFGPAAAATRAEAAVLLMRMMDARDGSPSL
ncbi:Chitinase [Paenibacillus pasadenensis]|uniref:Chitinase n=1 Tax=Paenibacillus pasadenensis TaxID=217090 RepID=A0A2N5N2I5_9BACL|nr:Ig-like domain-containing protein [Paenibacillus pasadenensis]PLT44548.1 Chitinase [Paenibacillus pasadenensis]